MICPVCTLPTTNGRETKCCKQLSHFRCVHHCLMLHGNKRRFFCPTCGEEEKPMTCPICLERSNFGAPKTDCCNQECHMECLKRWRDDYCRDTCPKCGDKEKFDAGLTEQEYNLCVYTTYFEETFVDE